MGRPDSRPSASATWGSRLADSTAVVPTDVPYVSRASIGGDRRDAWDAAERIDGGFVSTGGRKVAGSNPVAPIRPGGRLGGGPEGFLIHTERRRSRHGHGALAVVNLGDDADTTGAIYGQLAGAIYGAEAIPGEWLEKLVMKREIEAMAEGCLS